MNVNQEKVETNQECCSEVSVFSPFAVSLEQLASSVGTEVALWLYSGEKHNSADLWRQCPSQWAPWWHLPEVAQFDQHVRRTVLKEDSIHWGIHETSSAVLQEHCFRLIESHFQGTWLPLRSRALDAGPPLNQVLNQCWRSLCSHSWRSGEYSQYCKIRGVQEQTLTDVILFWKKMKMQKMRLVLEQRAVDIATCRLEFQIS